MYAATGGAVSSESVDLSNTYLEWAQRNFALNGIDAERHRTVRADVFQYLRDAQTQNKRFDLIVLDPPSFSNSKKMAGVLDVQRDHAELIDGAMSLLDAGGTLYFSNNLHSFRLDDALAARYRIPKISATAKSTAAGVFRQPENAKRHFPPAFSSHTQDTRHERTPFTQQPL